MNQFKRLTPDEYSKSEAIEFYKILCRIVGSIWTEDEGNEFFKRVVKKMSGIKKF